VIPNPILDDLARQMGLLELVDEPEPTVEQTEVTEPPPPIPAGWFDDGSSGVVT
jgi:hypothetical protein